MQNDERGIRELIATWLRASKAGDAEKAQRGAWGLYRDANMLAVVPS